MEAEAVITEAVQAALAEAAQEVPAVTVTAEEAAGAAAQADTEDNIFIKAYI